MHLKDLDEYSNAELYAELARRKKLTERACCSYCGRKGDTEPCKFPERHAMATKELKAREEHIRTGFRSGITFFGPRPKNAEQIKALYKW